MRRTSRAFSLVELLVVIGIIAVLIGVLIPVVSSVRKSAYTADSKNQIQIISNLIDKFHSDQGSYPGILTNAQVTQQTITFTNADTSAGQPASVGPLTQSENLVFALCGGLDNTGKFSMKEVGRGYHPGSGATVKRLPAYTSLSPQVLSTTGSSIDISTKMGYLGSTATIEKPDTANFDTKGFPEFVDRYPQAMPIIYLRARRSATGIYDPSGSPETTQYNPEHCKPYWDPYVNVPPGTKKGPDGISQDDFHGSGVLTPGLENYFGNPNLSTATKKVPKRQDTYMLISAGEDRIYGTADDINNFSF